VIYPQNLIPIASPVAALFAVVGFVATNSINLGYRSFLHLLHQPHPTHAIYTLRQQEPDTRAQVTQEQSVQIYWLQPQEGKMKLVAQPIHLNPDEQNVAVVAAIDRLLAGTSDEKMATTLPTGIEVRKIAANKTQIYLDLSQEFGSGGGSASMIGRVAQILYTSTTLNPEAQVWLSIEGEPLEVLGGEGLMLDRPLTRMNFGENFEL